MDLQLELIPCHYYNTLGFDAELIDYIDHGDDSIVLETLAPLQGWRASSDRSKSLLSDALFVLYPPGDLLVS